MEMRRTNAQALIRAGAIVTLGTDNYWASAPELARAPKVETQDHGIGTILAIEGLVELGMTPMQALMAATKNGGFAAGRDDLGTLVAGSVADLLVLDANPLADIKNIRTLRVVMANGRAVDRTRLPERRVLSRAPAVSQEPERSPAGAAGHTGADSISASSSARSTGFTRWPSNPASRVWRRSRSCPQPVTATSSSGSVDRRVRRRRAVSRPSMSGMPRSSSTAWGRNRSTSARAVAPS